MENKKQIKLMKTIDIQNVTVPTYAEKIDGRSNYVWYGEDNKFPNQILDMYLNCSVHQSICDGLAEYILGDGVECEFSIDRFDDESINKDDETLNDIVGKCALDYVIFGGFAVQIIYNALGEISELYWLDYSKCRVNKDYSTIFYSDMFARNGSGYQAIKYPKFDKNAEDKTSQVFYYRNPKSRNIYPIPNYFGSLKAIETQTEIANFNLNAIKNNFSASSIINVNNKPSEEEQQKYGEYIEDSLCGSDNAGSFLVFFNNSKEEATTIEKFESADFKDRYTQLEKTTTQNIFVGHRITSPFLFGLQAEGTGFSAVEYTEAFTIFNKTVIKPKQNDIARAFQKILGVPMSFKKFTIEELINKETNTLPNE